MGKLGVRVGPIQMPRRPEHPRKAEARRLYEIEGVNVKRIGRELGVPYGTVVGWTNTWIRAARTLEFTAQEGHG